MKYSLLTILLFVCHNTQAYTWYTEEDVAYLAEALYFEARGEDILSVIEVAHVIKNRVESNRWPDTVFYQTPIFKIRENKGSG